MLNVHYEPDEEVLREDEKYRASMSSSKLEPCTLNPLIDFSSVNQAQPAVMPPPLPSFQPSSNALPSLPQEQAQSKDKLAENDGNDNPPIGFNVDALASVPPSYNSVIANKPANEQPSAPSASNKNLGGSFPNLPDIPNDDLDSSDKSDDSKKSNNSKPGNGDKGIDDVDFDEIQRRFAELKKKK